MTPARRRVIVLVALAPVLLFVATRIGERMWLLSDSAAIDLTARDALHGDLPLVGVYSRFGWQHPGPFLFYWLVPFVFVSGGHAWGSAVGGAALEGLAVVCVARIVGTRDIRWLLGALASILFTVVALGDEGLAVPWNPHIAAVWFVVVVWLTWAVITGRVGLVGWWLVAASIVVQTHVGFAPLLAVCGSWVAGRLVVARRAGAMARPSWPSVAVAVALWVPVVIDQLGGAGNLHSLARWALGGGEGRVGLGRAAGMVASAFRVPPAWLAGQLDVDPFTSDVSRSSLVWLVLAIAVVAALAWFATDAPARALLALTGTLVLASVVTVAQIRDGAYAYVMTYVPAVAATSLVGAVLVASQTRRVARHAATILLAVAVLCATAVLTNRVIERGGPNDRAQGDFETLLDQLPPVEGPLLLRSTGGFASVYFGLVDELARAGIDVRIDPVDADKFGDKRVAAPDAVGQLWYVSEFAVDTDVVLERQGATTIATTSPLSSTREAELAAVRRRLIDQLRSAGRTDLLPRLQTSLLTVFLRDVPGVDQGAAAALADGMREIERSGRCQCAVIAVPVRP